MRNCTPLFPASSTSFKSSDSLKSFAVISLSKNVLCARPLVRHLQYLRRFRLTIDPARHAQPVRSLPLKKLGRVLLRRQHRHLFLASQIRMNNDNTFGAARTASIRSSGIIATGLSVRSSISCFGTMMVSVAVRSVTDFIVFRRHNACNHPAIRRRHDRRLIFLRNHRGSGSTMFVSKYSGSERFEPVRFGPIVFPTPYSVWHCWHVFPNTARPSDALGDSLG